MKGVFLDRDSIGVDLSLAELEALGIDWQFFPFTDQHQTTSRCLDADVVITNKVVLNRELLESLPNLKLILVAATGMNNVDLAAAKEQGIAVKNVVDYAGSSIAQLVFAYLLEFATQNTAYQSLVERGNWAQSKTFCLMDLPMFELAEKTITLIGYGNLAKSVEKIAKAFDMKVIIAEQKNAVEIRPGRVSFEQAIKTADVISLHCPLNAETAGLISAEELKAMKSSAILINTARGGIIDELALVEALNQGEIAGAATDVVTEEPAPNNLPIIQNKPKNLMITPHIAWASLEARTRLLGQLINHCETFLSASRQSLT